MGLNILQLPICFIIWILVSKGTAAKTNQTSTDCPRTKNCFRSHGNRDIFQELSSKKGGGDSWDITLNSTLNREQITYLSIMYLLVGSIIVLLNSLLLFIFCAHKKRRRPELWQLINVVVCDSLMGLGLAGVGIRRLVILYNTQENVQVPSWYCLTTIPTVMFALSLASYPAHLSITIERCFAMLSVRYRKNARRIAAIGLTSVWAVLAAQITWGVLDTLFSEPPPGSLMCFTEQVNSHAFANATVSISTSLSWLTVGVYLLVLLPVHRRARSQIEAQQPPNNQEWVYRMHQRTVTRNLLKVLALVFFMRTLPSSVMRFALAQSHAPAFLLRYVRYIYICLTVSYAGTFFVYGLSSGSIREAMKLTLCKS